MTKNQRPQTSPDRRVPPHDLDIERALLGAMMLSRDAIADAAGTLREHFYAPYHGVIYDAIVDLYLEDVLVDPVVLAHRLASDPSFAKFGGKAKLLDIQGATPASANAKHYAEAVQVMARQRQAITLAGEFAEAAYRGVDWHTAAAAVTDLANQNGVVYSPSTLETFDLAAILSGAAPPVVPFWLKRSDGHGLLYPGKVHDLHAEPNHGKGWTALFCVDEVLRAGGAAIYLDYEDDPFSIMGRLGELGCPAELLDPEANRFRYFRPNGPLHQVEIAEIDRTITEIGADLLILDGVAEALARDGFDEQSNSDVVTWGVKVPRHFADQGPAVLMLDHITKDPKHRARGARGAGAKLGLINGASFELQLAKPFSRRRAGLVKIKIAKDRIGQVGSIGETIAQLRVEPHRDGAYVELTLELPPPPLAEGEPFRPTGLMEKVSTHLRTAGIPHSEKLIYDSVRGKKVHVRQAIAMLVVDGFVAEDKTDGETRYRHVRPFTETEPAAEREVENSEPEEADVPMPDDPTLL